MAAKLAKAKSGAGKKPKPTAKKSASKKPAAKKSASKKAAAKKPAAKKGEKRWDDKPKNKLVAFWEEEKFLVKLDRALKKQGKFPSRSAFLKDCCEKLIEKHA